jgi:hypothetical protein
MAPGSGTKNGDGAQGDSILGAVRRVKFTHSEEGGEKKTAIEFNPDDYNEYFVVIDWVFGSLEQTFGTEVASKLFATFVVRDNYLRDVKNGQLMALYVNLGSPPVDKFAMMVAEMNASARWEARLGTGTTIAATLAKQVRRLLVRYKRELYFRQRVEQYACGCQSTDWPNAPFCPLEDKSS